MSDAAFSQIPAPYGPFGQDLSTWALDFAGAHRAEILAALTNTDDPVAWSGGTAELLKADGIPALTCIVNEHVEGLDVPPGVVLLPFVGSHELLASRELFTGDASQKPMVMLDVSAGLMNLWLSGAAQATCDAPVGIEEDTAFAMQIRGLKSFDLSEPGAAFQLLGAFGLGAVDTLAPGSTVARAMNMLWWGQEEPITNGLPPKGVGALATIDPSRTDEVLEFALGTPEIVGKVVAILAEDPALEKMMDVLGGNCRNEYMLPPDTCRPPDADNHHTLPNLMLTLLADMRRGAKPGLTRSQHGSDPQWGYLKTLPALSLGVGGIVNPLDVSDEQWQGSVDIASDIEESRVALQRSTLAVIDIARSTVGVLDALPSNTITGPTAASIQNASVFVDQVGGPMFSGVAGGLMREWELGTDPADADNYFELIGQLTIPALFRAATQFTYQNQGDDWMMMLRSGSNYPDATAMAEAMGLALPMDEIVGGAIGRSQSNFVGWMGVADDEPYMQVFAKQKYTLGSIEVTEATVSGYVDDLGASDIGEKFANMDFGLCAEVEQAVWPPGNPYISLFTMGMTPVATVGGYIQKRDGLISSGYKSGFAIDMSVPVVPIAGVRYGLDLGGFGEVEIQPGSLFPALQFGTCARPYVSGNVFGIELGEVEASIEFAFFGDLDDPDAEAGVKLRYEIAPEQYDLLRENLSCDVPPGPIEWVLCPIIDLAGEDLGIWLTLTNEAVYFGLGRFPNNGEEVIAAEFLPDGGIGLPGFMTVEGWGGFTKGDFSACADDLCGTIDAPPPGARYYDEPSLEGEDL
jgi:hypothetical protein